VTVYRTLKMLKTGGLVDELDLMHYGGDQHYYETHLKAGARPRHLPPVRQVEEFFGEPLQRLRKQIESPYRFPGSAGADGGGRLLARHCQTLRARELDELARTGRWSPPNRLRPGAHAPSAHKWERKPPSRRDPRLHRWWSSTPAATAPARPSIPSLSDRPHGGQPPRHPRQPRLAHPRAHLGRRRSPSG